MLTVLRSTGKAAALARVAGFLLTVTSLSDAHHDVAHSAGSMTRSLQGQGVDVLPRQRASLVVSVSEGSAQPTESPATSYGAAALLSVRLVPRLYVEAHVPVALIDEAGGSNLKFGLGDVALGVTWTLGGSSQTATTGTEGAQKNSADSRPSSKAELRPSGQAERARAPFALGMTASLPTRTFRYETDPGHQWSLTPHFRYASAGALFWYSQLLVPVETRPAGTAVDVSPGSGIGYRWPFGFSPIIGLHADVRVLTVCRTMGGSSVCPEGRVTETNRAHGTTRGYVHGALSQAVGETWAVTAGAQVPLTRARDVNWSFFLGVEARF